MSAPCAQCQNRNARGARFCNACGSPLLGEADAAFDIEDGGAAGTRRITACGAARTLLDWVRVVYVLWKRVSRVLFVNGRTVWVVLTIVAVMHAAGTPISRAACASCAAYAPDPLVGSNCNVYEGNHVWYGDVTADVSRCYALASNDTSFCGADVHGAVVATVSKLQWHAPSADDGNAAGGGADTETTISYTLDCAWTSAFDCAFYFAWVMGIAMMLWFIWEGVSLCGFEGSAALFHSSWMKLLLYCLRPVLLLQYIAHGDNADDARVPLDWAYMLLVGVPHAYASALLVVMHGASALSLLRAIASVSLAVLKLSRMWCAQCERDASGDGFSYRGMQIGAIINVHRRRRPASTYCLEP